jgi:hypothetical protein
MFRLSFFILGLLWVSGTSVSFSVDKFIKLALGASKAAIYQLTPFGVSQVVTSWRRAAAVDTLDLVVLEDGIRKSTNDMTLKYYFSRIPNKNWLSSRFAELTEKSPTS